ncbi:MAG: GFA family protein [Proteobacteria bacterium]|nr:GFA family protein [Pseudomonadota bacterium]
MMSVTHEGGCACSAIRYRVSGQPAIAQACHCSFCQRRTGSAFGIVAAFKEAQVEITGPALTVYAHRSDESSRWLRCHFCSRCGTTVLITLEKNPGVSVIPGGTFDDPGWLKLTRHTWTRSAHDWIVFPPDVEVRVQA